MTSKQGSWVAVVEQGMSDCAHPRSEAPTYAEECPITEGQRLGCPSRTLITSRAGGVTRGCVLGICLCGPDLPEWEVQVR